MEVFSFGLLLGLSTGVFCLGYCAPVLVPFLMAERRSATAPVRLLLEVAAGRLVGYLAVGAAVGYLGLRAESALVHRASGLAMVGLGLLLALFLLRRVPTHVAICRWANSLGPRYPMLFGLLTGFNLCPPFLAAIAFGAATGEVARSIALFAGFFVGTTAFLVPLIPLGWAGRWQNVRTVGRMAGSLCSTFLLAAGAGQLLA